MYSLRFEVMMVLICRMIAAGNQAADMLEAVQSQVMDAIACAHDQ